MSLPANQLPIGRGVDPEDRAKTAPFFADKAMVRQLEDHGPQWKLDDSRFVDQAIQKPDAIYRRVSADTLRDTWCYCVRPTVDPDEPDLTGLPRYGFAFLSFVRQCTGGYLVIDWEWREEDGECPGCPLENSDLGSSIWKA